jgi:hypothetical protein
VFQAGLKGGFCPALASSGPVCPGIALLLAHCLAAWPLPPAYGLGDGAKPPENRQDMPVAAVHQLSQDGAGMDESEKQFSFTLAASSTSGRAKNQIPISPSRTSPKVAPSPSPRRTEPSSRARFLRHRWIESKNAGYAIDVDRDIRDWLKKHHALWAAAQDTPAAE